VLTGNADIDHLFEEARQAEPFNEYNDGLGTYSGVRIFCAMLYYGDDAN
jgi:hypothetical protein